MQITQFVLGSTMAASYLFVHYTVPSKTQSSTAPPAVASGGLVPWLKQFAAGEDGGAGTQPGFGNQMITCMDTTGQAFAIWLNVLYLLPLTYLFARFFVRSYLYRKDTGAARATSMNAAEKAGLDALKGVSREIQRSVEMNGEASEATEDESKVQAKNHAQGQDQSNGSPRKTRSSTANRKKSAAAAGNSPKESSQGFSSVPAKKGSKKTNKKEPPPSVPEARGQNPFEVLDGKS